MRSAFGSHGSHSGSLPSRLGAASGNMNLGVAAHRQTAAINRSLVCAIRRDRLKNSDHGASISCPLGRASAASLRPRNGMSRTGGIAGSFFANPHLSLLTPGRQIAPGSFSEPEAPSASGVSLCVCEDSNPFKTRPNVFRLYRQNASTCASRASRCALPIGRLDVALKGSALGAHCAANALFTGENGGGGSSPRKSADKQKQQDQS